MVQGLGYKGRVTNNDGITKSNEQNPMAMEKDTTHPNALLGDLTQQLNSTLPQGGKMNTPSPLPPKNQTITMHTNIEVNTRCQKTATPHLQQVRGKRHKGSSCLRELQQRTHAVQTQGVVLGRRLEREGAHGRLYQRIEEGLE